MSNALNILAFDTSSEVCSVGLINETDCYLEREDTPRQHAQLLMPMISSLMSEADLELSQLDAIAFACGPGSFTGLRIAAGVAQGLCFGSQVPVISISNLQALAFRFFLTKKHKFALSVIDARMDELYWSVFSRPDDMPVLDEFSFDHALKVVSSRDPESLIPSYLGVEEVSAPERVFESNRDVGLIKGLRDEVQSVSAGSVGLIGSGSRFYERFPAKVKEVLVQETLAKDVVSTDAQDIALLARLLFLKNEQIIEDAARVQPTYLRNEVAWNKLPGR